MSRTLSLNFAAVLIGLSFLNPVASHAGGSGQPGVHPWAIPVEFNTPGFTTGEVAAIKQKVNTLISIIGLYPPNTKNLFEWSKDTSVLTNKNYRMIFLPSREARDLVPDLPAYEPGGPWDFMVLENEEGVSVANTIIYLDEYFPDGPAHADAGGFVRLMIDIAINVYGGVQMYLDSPKLGIKDETPGIEFDEDFSYAVALRFLDDLIAADAIEFEEDVAAHLAASYRGFDRRRAELVHCGTDLLGDSTDGPPPGKYLN